MIGKFIPLNRHSAVHPNFLCYLVFKLPRYHKKELRPIVFSETVILLHTCPIWDNRYKILEKCQYSQLWSPIAWYFQVHQLGCLTQTRRVSTTVAQSSSRSPSVCAALQTRIKCKIPFLLAREGNAVEFGWCSEVGLHIPTQHHCCTVIPSKLKFWFTAEQ